MRQKQPTCVRGQICNAAMLFTTSYACHNTREILLIITKITKLFLTASKNMRHNIPSEVPTDGEKTLQMLLCALLWRIQNDLTRFFNTLHNVICVKTLLAAAALYGIFFALHLCSPLLLFPLSHLVSLVCFCFHLSFARSFSLSRSGISHTLCCFGVRARNSSDNNNN